MQRDLVDDRSYKAQVQPFGNTKAEKPEDKEIGKFYRHDIVEKKQPAKSHFFHHASNNTYQRTTLKDIFGMAVGFSIVPGTKRKKQRKATSPYEDRPRGIQPFANSSARFPQFKKSKGNGPWPEPHNNG